MMKYRSHLKFFAVSISVFGIAAGQENVVRKPLAIGTKMEMGQVVNGEPNKTGEDPDNFSLSRMAVSLTQEVTVDDRIEMKVGVGGVFYTLFPDVRGQAGSQGIKFGPGITQAQIVYKLGAIDQPWGVLRAGYFPYKYNPDAKNLGEYLLRSMPYPSFVTTGGWAITDNAFVRAQGVQATFYNLNGMLKSDFLLTTERDFRPAGNFTPSFLTEFTSGPLQLGAGVSFFHFLPLDSDRLKSRDMGLLSIYRYDSVPAFNMVHDPFTSDTIPGDGYSHPGGTVYMTGAERQALTFENNPGINWDSLDAFRDTIGYNTKGIKLMVRGSFSIQKIIPIPILNPNDLKVYAEAALLGVKNQPVLYEKRMERVPIMVGVNLPTFRMLDYLSFEVEYFPSRLPDDWEKVQYDNIPVFEAHSLLLWDTDKYNNKGDDWKWSLYAAKTLARGVSLRAQVANDHLRSIDQATNTFSGQSLMRDKDNWYYVLALNFGI